MPRLSRVPDLGAEVLRLLLVVFGAAVGFQVGTGLQADNPGRILGLFDVTVASVIVGAGLGYSLGGVFSRRLLRSIERGERRLNTLPPDQVVAGFTGAIVGMVGVSLVAWPLFLLGPAAMMAALFAFLVVLGALAGFRIARTRGAVIRGDNDRATKMVERSGFMATPRAAAATDARTIRVFIRDLWASPPA